MATIKLGTVVKTANKVNGAIRSGTVVKLDQTVGNGVFVKVAFANGDSPIWRRPTALVVVNDDDSAEYCPAHIDESSQPR